MKRVAFMFPGQGSQAVGMGKAIYDSYPEAETLYNESNNILNKKMTELMFYGPKETLTETENAQPALLISSIVIFTLLLKQEIKPVMAIGHSLGEYSALVAAGAIQLEEALPLVAARGRLMEEAFPKGQGLMAAVLGLSQEEIEDALQHINENEIVDIANLNCPGQIVISGTMAGLKQAEPILKEKGARRFLPLNVSGPFHSRLMKLANEAYTNKLNHVEINDTTIPIYANVTASPVTESEKIKDLLIKQLYSPVRFEESIRNMVAMDIDGFVEIGNGRVLSGLVKKIDRNIPTFSVQDPKSMEEFITWYKGES